MKIKENKHINLPPINKRIKQMVDKFSNGNVAKFVELIGFNKHQNFNRILNIDTRNGKYPQPSAEILNCIKINLPQVNYDWLLTGDGEMLTNQLAPQPAGSSSDGVVVSGEAWNMIKLQLQTINNQQLTIQSQQQTIDFLTKKGDIAGNAQIASVG